MGVVAAIIKFYQSTQIDKEIANLGAAVTPEAITKIKEGHNLICSWADSNFAVWLGGFMLILISYYLIRSSLKAKPEVE